MSDESRPILQSEASQTRFNMSQKMENQKRKKVLVVGAGAAGMDS
jgi:NADPH-dependent glutamate synthase beta subunit-like oxidoreductase